MLVAVCVLVGFALGMTGRFVWSGWFFIVFGVAVAAMLGFVATDSLMVRRTIRRHNWLLCTQCCYPLSPSPVVGRCPECGMEYDVNEIRAAWQYFYP